MQNLGYLLAVLIVVWALVFGYVLWLIFKQRELHREIKSLKEKNRR